MERSESITNLVSALALFQGEIKTIPKDKINKHLNYKYASLDSIIATCSPILSRHGLSVSQRVNDEGVETFLFHKDGEWMSTGILRFKPEDDKAQKHGIVITYARKYQLTAMLCVSADEDTDGQTNRGGQKNVAIATKTEMITEDQKEEIRELAEQINEWSEAMDLHPYVMSPDNLTKGTADRLIKRLEGHIEEKGRELNAVDSY